MLLVNAKAESSGIHRLGLVAHESIRAGVVVWKFQPGFDVRITLDQFAALPQPVQNQVRYYAYFCRSSNAFLLSSDDDRFTNHSDQPNTRMEGDDMVALRDIHPGEEITCDYREVGMLDIPREGEAPAEPIFS